MLQKFINLKHELGNRQGVEGSKLKSQLKVKRYATTIVGKIEGAASAYR